MHALITGGAGFIGSHLTELLLAQGHTVTIIDDLSTGSIENIKPFKNNEHFNYHLESVNHTKVLKELIDQSDVVFHLAAAVGVRLIVDSPVRTIETNLSGTEKVLEVAALKQKKVIFTSTSEVYGKSQIFPYREDHDLVIGPSTIGRWSYACSKAMDEFLAIAYWKEKKVPVVIARLFNAAGPRQVGRYGMVIPRFIQQALKSKDLTVYGNGQQTRTFCHVTDTCRALAELAQNDNCIGHILNIGSDQPISILNLAKKIITLAHSSSAIKFIPYAEAFEEGFEDMQDRLPDIQKIKKFVNFSPRKDLDDILNDTIAWYKNLNF